MPSNTNSYTQVLFAHTDVAENRYLTVLLGHVAHEHFKIDIRVQYGKDFAQHTQEVLSKASGGDSFVANLKSSLQWQ